MTYQLKNVNGKKKRGETEKAKQFRFMASAPRIMKMKFLCSKEVQQRILWILLEINTSLRLWYQFFKKRSIGGLMFICVGIIFSFSAFVMRLWPQSTSNPERLEYGSNDELVPKN